MRHLIVLAHGSDREQPNEEIRQLTRNIASHLIMIMLLQNTLFSRSLNPQFQIL
jgi:hypothetical protein